MPVIIIIFWFIYTIKITIIIIKLKTTVVCWLQISWRRKGVMIFLRIHKKAFYSCASNICITSKAWKTTVSINMFWLMYTMKIFIISIRKKILLFVGCRCHEEWKGVLICFETTHIFFYLCVSNICITSKAWKLPVINIIFWLLFTVKITMIYINEKVLLFWLQVSRIRKKRNDIFLN